eukprot:TRINITY_DN7087_c0_g2_i1.p1 TRINITY_DN7087_c0_g2~~TRINITY_DN7087_c0_g2_i1.p1  ORF type:complete len:310 (+),score=52.77 TRINITY_DN7087_c0_g2_i1:721-1650(+)
MHGTKELPLDEWISQVRTCRALSEDQMKRLCNHVKLILMEESNVRVVAAPVNICGDIHGQFFDLLELFKTGGQLEDTDTNYVFMGDYVDRGMYGIETITYLFLLKAMFPHRVTLIRGNHESRSITQMYGFYDEIMNKYGNPSVWQLCCSVFDYLNIAALIEGQILCLHGGLSPELPTIDKMRTLSRAQEIPHKGPLCDMMWSDPEEVETWEANLRGAGYYFGAKVTKQFNHNNGLDLIARSHQLVEEGFKYMFDDSLVTVWSAPNYCGRCGNVASVMAIDDQMDRDFKIFSESTEANKRKVSTLPGYFM